MRVSLIVVEVGIIARTCSIAIGLVKIGIGFSHDSNISKLFKLYYRS